MTEHQAALGTADRRVAGLILILIVGYILATAAGWTRGAPLAGHATLPADMQCRPMPLPKPRANRPRPPSGWSCRFLAAGGDRHFAADGGAAHWWERNVNKFYVAANLALVTLLYLAFLHPPAGFWQPTRCCHTMHSEYIPFIVLLFSLYTISGGIRIAGDLPAHPLTNLPFWPSGACWPASSARPARRCC